MKHSIKELIERYIESKKRSWSESTSKSERYRLSALAPYLTGEPSVLWDHIHSTLAPYSRVTAYIRATAFWQWCLTGGYLEKDSNENRYQTFRQENKKLFKNSYERKKAPCSFEEAKKRLGKIEDAAVRLKATSLLMHGLRYSELGTVEDGSLYGKGDKRRRLYGLDVPAELLVEVKKVSYSTLNKALSDVGLKPHDLRKIFATRLVERGINHFDLCEVMGWSSIQTATCYIAPRDAAALNEFVKDATNGSSKKR